MSFGMLLILGVEFIERMDSDVLYGLPGEDLIRQGIADRKSGVRSEEACLVEMAEPRLIKAGLLKDGVGPSEQDEGSELFLYSLLMRFGNQAYSKYSALLRQLTSFEHALDHRLRGQHPLTTSSIR